MSERIGEMREYAVGLWDHNDSTYRRHPSSGWFTDRMWAERLRLWMVQVVGRDAESLCVLRMTTTVEVDPVTAHDQAQHHAGQEGAGG